MCEECKKNDSRSKMTQEEFDEIFLGMLGSWTESVWLDEDGREIPFPTCRFELRNSDEGWKMDINLDPKNQHFILSGDRDETLFKREYGLEVSETQRLMKNLMSKLFKMNDVTPRITGF